MKIRYLLTRVCTILVVMTAIMAVSASTTSALSYNRNSAVYYADLWWDGVNPNFVYYGANDCTNFISQVLLYGGVPEVIASGYIRDPDAWFYNSGIHSNSWSVAMSPGNPTGGLVGHAYRYLGNRFDANLYISTLQAGDFVMFDQVPPLNSGPATHGRIGIGWLWDSDTGAYKYKMSQHSPSRYHVNWDFGWNPNLVSNWKISVHT